jgi:hypothetical protein
MKITDLKDYTVLSQGASETRAPKASKPVANQVSDFLGAKGLTDLAGSQIAKFGLAASGNTAAANRVEQPSMKDVLGSSLQFGANFAPGAGIGAGLARKVAVGAGTGYAIDVGSKLQQDKSVPESLVPGVGTAVGTVLPVGGAGINFAGRVMGRLFKGLGSGISGVSTETLDKMLNNPQFAQEATDRLAKNGNFKVIESNAKTLVNGVAKIKKEAGAMYQKGLGELKETDIDPKMFRDSVQPLLDKLGVSKTGGVRTIGNVEFTDPKNLQKASSLLDRLNNNKLDGASLRKLADDIENAKYKVATSDERLSFNAFINELSGALKGAISSATGKLDEINSKYSSDMQLVEAAQNIFGKVNYRNVAEVAKAARSLESLFNKKGLDPKTIDDFLARIGVSADDFRTTEAVRQISNKEAMAPNAPGFNLGEIVRTATGSIVTPETVRDLTIKTGLAKEKLAQFLTGVESLPSALQKVVIQALQQSRQPEEQGKTR